MAVVQRTYTPQPLFTSDYEAVRSFFIRINQPTLHTAGFPWSRWEWMTTHRMLNRAHLGRIGLWEEDGVVVAIATYETDLGDAYLFTDPQHTHLKPDLVAYARRHLTKEDGSLRILVEPQDLELSRIVRRKGFIPIQEKEETTRMDIADLQDAPLPEGFKIISMADSWDWNEYNRCMWRGFNHGDEPSTDPEVLAGRKQMLSSPMVDPELVLAVVAPDEHYVAHCGLWHNPGEDYAYIEPVATDPTYRKQGLGRAVVLENIRRAEQRGVKTALVGSTQDFYYHIGFAPYHSATWWQGKGVPNHV